MSWHFVERWLQKVNQHSTLIGKFWVTFIIVFRIVVVSSVGDRVYSDEQSEFKCNTMQVGCPNVCFNKFSPISHIRFWSFQIVMVTTPSIVFMVYSAHQIKRKPSLKEKASTNAQTPSPSKKAEAAKEAMNDENPDKNKWKRSQNGRPPSVDCPDQVEQRKTVIQEMFGEDKAAFSQHYVLYALSVVMRTGIEVVFLYLQYIMFGFHVAELYKCSGEPCPNTVDCFVSRPKEKTIFLCFMFAIALLCFILNAFELQYLFWQFCVRRPRIVRARKRYRKTSTVSECMTVNTGDGEIVDGGTVNPPPAYPTSRIDCRNIELCDMDTIDISQLAGAHANPMTMSFSLDELLLPENTQPTSQYLSYQIKLPSVTSSSNNNLSGPTDQKLVHDQPYLANPRAINARQNAYSGYI